MRISLPRRSLKIPFPPDLLHVLALLLGWTPLLLCARPSLAETSDPAALAAIKQAVEAELHANATDRTPWAYRDHDIQPGTDAIYRVVETPKGDLKRMMELNGTPLRGSAESREMDRMRDFVNSPAEQARQHKAGQADGAQAREFLSMLPTAFFWTPVGETPQTITLNFRPDPAFNPPDSQSKVLAVLAGQVVIARDGHRIASLRGTLTNDVKFGLGLFGKIDKGGTFNIERREIEPGKWEITETHVHISGRALLFKTIGQQEDEAKSEWQLSTAPNLQAALQQLEN